MDSYGTRQAAVAVARELERAAARADHRGSGGRRSAGARVFIDFNQNAPHKTVFGAWCVRARAGRPGVDAVRAGTSSPTSTPTS